MKRKTLIIGHAVSMLIAESGFAQGTFQNLNFEQAEPVFVNGISGPYVTVASALPYWTAEIGGVQQTEIYQNGGSTGAAEISLLTSISPQPPLDGNYSVLLQANPLASASISQTGEIPPGSQSLLFDAQGGYGQLTVTIGNDSLTLFSVSAGPNYEVYGANITAWSGQTEQLAFTATTSYSIGLVNWELDDISFSPTSVVPEPSPLVLTAIGGVLFGLYRRFAVKRP
jgi:hypothetical protein